MCVSYCSGVDRNPDSMCSTTIAKVFMFSVAAGCIYATLHPAFRRPKYRSCRAGMYAGLGLSFVISIVHGITEFGWKTQYWRMSLDWMAVMTTFNSTGGALYAMRVSACVPYGRRVTQGCDRAGNSPDSREMVPLQIRNMGLEPSNHALYGGLCWYRAFIRAFEGV
jgi:predicted membrane channel-forming protein YqfA (hemolysin III family)